MAASNPLPGDREPALVAGLRSPLCYPHPADAVALLETHISWVLLAGDYAYKVKKPVELGFLDFSTLELRRRCCEEEVRLNRRAAPSLYVDVVAITGTAVAPVVGGEGEAIEYAVRMRRFPQADLLDERARRGRLGPADIDALAEGIAGFHARAAIAPAGYAPGAELRLALDNLEALRGLEAGVPPGALEALREWTGREHRDLRGLFERRRQEGCVRECHGDLHLGNLVMLEGRPVPFDGIEFNEALRWIDVMSDVAFVAMDLRHHGLPGLAARFLDAYLGQCGDYGGAAVLRYYSVYRALVRAKVCAIRAAQAAPGSPARRGGLEDAAAHIRLATTLATRPEPALTIMHGPSGSGKTTASQRLLEAQGAIRLRSDVERKRLQGLPARTRASERPGEGLYAATARRAVYSHLAVLAGRLLAAGYPVVVDAAFLERAERDRFRDLARAAGCRFAIVSCEAPEAVLRARVAARLAAGSDASDAGLAVLASQLAGREPLSEEERSVNAVVDASGAA